MTETFDKVKIAALFESGHYYVADDIYGEPKPFPYVVWQRDYVWQCFASADLFRKAPLSVCVDKLGHVDIWMKIA